MTRSRLFSHYLLHHRLLLLLLCLLAVFVAFPLISTDNLYYSNIVEFFFIALLLSNIYIISHNKRILAISLLIVLLASTLIAYHTILRSNHLLLAGLSIEVVFLSITMATLVHHVLNYQQVTAEKIYGAICAYLLIGIIWALIYTMIALIEPSAFQVSFTTQHHFLQHAPHRFYFTQFLYYSFVTLSTLGYGDIIPVKNFARAFSALEAIIGQLYVAILIARLVGLHIYHMYLFDKKKSSKK